MLERGRRYLDGPQKRCLDVVVSGAALITTSPLIAGLALLKFIEDGENPLFIQDRVGKNGEIIKIVKIRSMRSGDESDEIRVTKLGRWLRKTHLDELPQFFLIMRGDMTVVGPRPITIRALDNAINKRGSQGKQMRRDYESLKSGLTGIWQVNGTGYDRDYLMYHPNRYYLQEGSILSDLKIIVKTVKKVLKG